MREAENRNHVANCIRKVPATGLQVYVLFIMV